MMNMHALTRRPKVMVVGGGSAGLHAARAAARRGARVTLVDRDGRHDFIPRLAAVAGGTAPVRDASRPASAFVARVVRGSVSEVGDGWVRLDDGTRLESDVVVVTTGAEVSRPPIEGLEHALGLRSAADAIALRSVVSTSDSLVIVGGGATGVQLAGAAAIAHPGLRIHLVEASERLLGTLPRELAVGARRILEDRGVGVELGCSVEAITSNGVETSKGPFKGPVVWAGGFEADTTNLGLPTEDNGRISIDRALRVRGMGRTLAAGDVAAHVDGRGAELPMSAQVAVRAGNAAGANAVRIARGRRPRPVNLSQIGWVLDLGGRRGLAQVGPVSFSAPLLDQIPPALHDLIDLRELVEIGGLPALRFAPASVVDPLGLHRKLSGAEPHANHTRHAARMVRAA